MQRFPYLSSRPITAHLEQKPVWILLTALAFGIIALMTVYSSTPVLAPVANPLNLAVAGPTASSLTTRQPT
jgi:hypothetical protein